MANTVFVCNKEMAPVTKILQPQNKLKSCCCCLCNTRLILCDSQDYPWDDVHFSTIKTSATSMISNSL